MKTQVTVQVAAKQPSVSQLEMLALLDYRVDIAVDEATGKHFVVVAMYPDRNGILRIDHKAINASLTVAIDEVAKAVEATITRT